MVGELGEKFESEGVAAPGRPRAQQTQAQCRIRDASSPHRPHDLPDIALCPDG